MFDVQVLVLDGFGMLSYSFQDLCRYIQVLRTARKMHICLDLDPGPFSLLWQINLELRAIVEESDTLKFSDFYHFCSHFS